MSAPGRYGGYGVRPRSPGNARFPIPGFLDQETNRRIAETARAASRTPFMGLTTDGTVVPNLFAFDQPGPSTQPVKDAAEELLLLLTEDQRNRLLFPIDALEWRQWANNTRPILRHGLLLEALTVDQREAVLGVVQATLSQHGFDTVRGAMRLNETLAEIAANTAELGEWIYFFTMFGRPSTDEPWGWQIDGHHLILNCFILGNRIVLTPAFVGAEPTIADRGIYAGTQILLREQQAGLDLIQSLNPSQRNRAIIFPSVLADNLPSGRWAPGDGRLMAGAHKDNLVFPYEGIRPDDLTAGQQEALLRLVETYVGYAGPGHAESKMAEVRRHLDETHFAWIGDDGDDAVFYYRVHSPVIWIEFDHQNGVFLDNDQPERFHIHTVVRTPNGNDYGRDLLRQHYERFPHSSNV